MRADRLGDYVAPAGTEIYISPYLLQRHPNLWVDPDRFDPESFGSNELQERHPLTMCPFGTGPRNCIGEYFARVEMQIHLLTIAKALRLRYDDLRAAEMAAEVNLLSRHHFFMKPENRKQHPMRD